MKSKVEFNLVEIINNREVRTTSLKVAEYFGKSHKHVLRRIKEVIKKGTLAEPNFRLCFFDDKFHKRLPYYEIDKDGFVLLALGFTGDKAHQFKLQYIIAFNKALELLQKKEQELLEAKFDRHQKQITNEKNFLVKRLEKTQKEKALFNIDKALTTFGTLSSRSGLPRTKAVSYFRGENKQTVAPVIDELGIYGHPIVVYMNQ